MAGSSAQNRPIGSGILEACCVHHGDMDHHIPLLVSKNYIDSDEMKASSLVSLSNFFMTQFPQINNRNKHLVFEYVSY
jgi:hypothetical protein